jgi:site-specific DNA recombinase
MRTLRLIGYIRVSTEDQARNGVSLADQEAKIRAYAALTDGELLEVVRDEGRSGKDLDRPGVREALSRVLSGEADALVVYAIDRLSRSALDLLGLVARLQEAGRGFVSVREQMDSTTPHGRFTMTILAAVAEMEREMIRARCRDASARCFRERRVYGKTPFGFRRDGKRLVEDPREMETLLGIVALREEGVPFHAIAERLNARGTRSKTGGRWHASSVRSVLLTYQKLTA